MAFHGTASFCFPLAFALSPVVVSLLFEQHLICRSSCEKVLLHIGQTRWLSFSCLLEISTLLLLKVHLLQWNSPARLWTLFSKVKTRKWWVSQQCSDLWRCVDSLDSLFAGFAFLTNNKFCAYIDVIRYCTVVWKQLATVGAPANERPFPLALIGFTIIIRWSVLRCIRWVCMRGRCWIALVKEIRYGISTLERSERAKAVVITVILIHFRDGLEDLNILTHPDLASLCEVFITEQRRAPFQYFVELLRCID